MTFLGITLCLHGVPTEGKMVDQPYQGVVHGLPQVNHEVEVQLVGNKRRPLKRAKDENCLDLWLRAQRPWLSYPCNICRTTNQCHPIS